MGINCVFGLVWFVAKASCDKWTCVESLGQIRELSGHMEAKQFSDEYWESTLDNLNILNAFDIKYT